MFTATAKYCEYCRKYGHTDAECWCTRALPSNYKLVASLPPLKPNPIMSAYTKHIHDRACLCDRCLTEFEKECPAPDVPCRLFSKHLIHSMARRFAVVTCEGGNPLGDRFKFTTENLMKYIEEIDSHVQATKDYASDMESIAPQPRKNVDKAARLLEKLTNEQRLQLFSEYCKMCGSDNPQCQCWNDE